MKHHAIRKAFVGMLIMHKIKDFLTFTYSWLDSISHSCFVFIVLMMLSFIVGKDSMGFCFFAFSLLSFVLKWRSYIKTIHVSKGDLSIELTSETKESFSKLGFECYDDLLNTVTAENVEEFKRKKLSLPLTLQNDKKQRVEVDTLYDYEEYDKKGYYAPTTYDIKTQSYYELVSDFLEYFLTINAKNSVLYSLLDQPANRVLTSMGPDDVKPGGLSVRNFLDQNNGILKMNDDCLELNMEYGESYYFKILSRLTFIENFYEEYFITVYYQSGGTHGHCYDLKLRKMGSFIEVQ
ncbi:MAG: hypothetical protein SPL25_12630 [Succinivibrionaceae bacterium]|nr:hypothetical protein [Succinivibrionaceae bacterium]